MMQRWTGALIATSLALTGCPEPELAPTAVVATVSRVDEPQDPPSSAEPVAIPPLGVDRAGALIGEKRVDLTTTAGRAELSELTGRLPLDSRPVTLQAEKDALTGDVMLVVAALARAGARALIIETEVGRGLAGTLKVVPDMHAAPPAACSVVAMVGEHHTTAVWSAAGGGGKKYRKGFAGPDLSSAREGIVELLQACDSSAALFSGNLEHRWRYTYSIGALIEQADAADRIDSLILLTAPPIPGRELELGRR